MSQNLNRGNKLWEGSRMFLPEHKQALLKRKKNQQKESKPLLDEQQLEEMNQRILFSKTHHLPVRITFFKEGFFEEITGYPADFLETDNQLRFTDRTQQTHLLKLSTIYDVHVLEKPVAED